MQTDIEQNVFLGRQPILDREGELVAYEMLFRSAAVEYADIRDDVHATASVVSAIVGSLGIDNVVGPHRRCYLNVNTDLLMDDALELLPRHRVVIEILETTVFTDEVLERCRYLKELGFTLALDDFTHVSRETAAILNIIDIVKVDVLEMSPDDLATTVNQLAFWPVTLLAEKVDSREQHELCLELGFHLFQGFYFAKPLVVIGKQIPSADLALINLLNLLMSDADTAEIEEALKAQPHLVMQLLRMVNSVSTGWKRTITSVRDAIVVVGRKQLLRWLKLLLYAQPSHTSAKSAEPLLLLAAQRARHMELMADELNLDPDQAFLAGLLSLLNALFNIPTEDVVDHLNLTEEMEHALLHHGGFLGELLGLVELFEQGDAAGIESRIAVVRHPTVEAAYSAQQEAIAWTTKVAGSLGGS